MIVVDQIDGTSRSLDEYLSGFTSYLDGEMRADGREYMDAMAAFVLELDVRIRDRRYCRCVEASHEEVVLDMGKLIFTLLRFPFFAIKELPEAFGLAVAGRWSAPVQPGPGPRQREEVPGGARVDQGPLQVGRGGLIVDR